MLILITALLTQNMLAQAKESVSQGLFKYHSQLAAGGDPESMYVVANMYEYGRGIKQNYVQAMKWYKLAGKNGNLSATAKMVKLRKKISLHSSKKRQRIKSRPPSKNKPALANKPAKKRDIMSRTSVPIRQLNLSKPQKIPGVRKPFTKSPQPRNAARNTTTSQQRSQRREIERLKAETEKAQRESELARIRSQKLELEKANLMLQIELDKEVQIQLDKERVAVQKKALDKEFDSNPCNGPSARFMSTCR